MPKRFLCFLLSFCVSCLTVRADPEVAVHGYTGDSATLPCNHPGTADVTGVSWRFTDDRNVHSYAEGRDILQEQDPQFRNRTRLFPSELVKGNVSLQISALGNTDAGTYSCFVTGVNKVTQVKLRVKGLCLWSQRVQSVTETTARPGHNVTIQCGLRDRDVYWYTQTSSGSIVLLLRSLSGLAQPFYYDGPRDKYSLQNGGRLLIHNVTQEDCVLYYCAVHNSSSMWFSNGTRLIVEGLCPEKHSRDTRRSCLNFTTVFPLLTGFFISNCVLIIVVIVLVKQRVTSHQSSQRKRDPTDEDPLYSVIPMNAPEGGTGATQITSTYCELRPVPV